MRYPLRVTIDVHTHIFPSAWPDFAARYGGDRWPRLEGDPGAQAGLLEEHRERAPGQRWSGVAPGLAVLGLERAIEDRVVDQSVARHGQPPEGAAGDEDVVGAGIDPLRALVAHPATAGVPLILETPGSRDAGDPQIPLLKQLREEAALLAATA